MAGIGAGIGGVITGIISAILQERARQQQMALERENLQFQKDTAGKQYKLSTAGRTDAYGNKTSYNDLLNEWITDLTPTQRGLVRAGEREQRLSLTEDAMRNRDTRRRQADRARGATEDYNAARTEARFGGPPSEGAIRDEISGLLANQRSARRADSLGNLARSAFRTNSTRNFAGIVDAANASGRETAADDALKARQAALAEYMTRRGAQESSTGSRMAQAAQTMDSVGGAPQLFSSAPQTMSSNQSEMLQAIMAALQSGGSSVGNALRGLASTAGRSVSLDGIGSGLGGIIDALMSRSDGTDQSTMRPIVYNPTKGEQIYWPVAPDTTRNTGRSIF